MTNQSINILKSIIEKESNLFFQNLGFKIHNCKIDIIKVDLNNNQFVINMNLAIDNPEILIGERGETLAKIQHILRTILRKKITFEEEKGESFFFYLNLDIDNYKEKREKYLQKMAKDVAKEVILTGKEKILEIMPNYERRIIHLTLKDNDKVLTESIKDGRDKRIVIKLKT